MGRSGAPRRARGRAARRARSNRPRRRTVPSRTCVRLPPEPGPRAGYRSSGRTLRPRDWPSGSGDSSFQRLTRNEVDTVVQIITTPTKLFNRSRFGATQAPCSDTGARTARPSRRASPTVGQTAGPHCNIVHSEDAPSTPIAVLYWDNASGPDDCRRPDGPESWEESKMHLVTERNRKWWVVIAMAITTLLMTIDFNGLTVALPTIGRDLDTSTTGLQWTINAYLLALAAPSVAAGRLADIFGRRKVLLIGTVGLAIGPLTGGFLTQTLSWRWFFFVNIPVAVLAIVLTLVTVRESKDESASAHVDLLGSGSAGAGHPAG